MMLPNIPTEFQSPSPGVMFTATRTVLSVVKHILISAWSLTAQAFCVTDGTDKAERIRKLKVHMTNVLTKLSNKEFKMSHKYS